MNKDNKKISQPAPSGNRREGLAATASPQAPAKERRWKRLLPYATGFVLLWFFSTFVYGDVYQRAEQESFVTFDAGQMKFLTDQAWGRLYWAARVLLLVFKSPLLGGLFLAAVGTLTAVLLDRLLGCGGKWRGAGFLLPAAASAFFVWRGLNLYYYAEPSVIVWLPLCLLALVGICCGIAALLRRRAGRSPEGAGLSSPRQGQSAARAGNSSPRSGRVPWPGLLLVVAAFAGLCAFARTYGLNTLLASRMQNRVATADWEGILSDALDARRPTRTVAAYHAIALVQTGQLLERLFEIPYDYPDPGIDEPERTEEGKNYIPDCNFYAGLTNPAYRMCMEKMETEGPSVFTLKRMVLCTILNGDDALARKYLRILSTVPFEQAFVDRYSPLVGRKDLVAADPELACVQSLAPLEDKFEQAYRPIAFLGYNYGVSYGKDATLITSTAVALYSKDLQNVLVRASYLRQKQALPQAVKQAVTLAAMKNPQVYAAFPEVDAMTQSEVKAFLTAAAPYKADRKEMKEKLKKDWLGTYMYYYYCGNIDNEAGKTNESKEKGGVN